MRRRPHAAAGPSPTKSPGGSRDAQVRRPHALESPREQIDRAPFLRAATTRSTRTAAHHVRHAPSRNASLEGTAPVKSRSGVTHVGGASAATSRKYSPPIFDSRHGSSAVLAPAGQIPSRRPSTRSGSATHHDRVAISGAHMRSMRDCPSMRPQRTATCWRVGVRPALTSSLYVVFLCPILPMSFFFGFTDLISIPWSSYCCLCAVMDPHTPLTLREFSRRPCADDSGPFRAVAAVVLRTVVIGRPRMNRYTGATASSVRCRRGRAEFDFRATGSGSICEAALRAARVSVCSYPLADPVWGPHSQWSLGRKAPGPIDEGSTDSYPWVLLPRRRPIIAG
jgi:hypothetical protein